jgi:drug/metabolite transporter (DMT)-like permease
MTDPTMDAMNASDWMKGIFFSVLASWIGAASKLAIRKSWLMEQERNRMLLQLQEQQQVLHTRPAYRGSSWDESAIHSSNSNPNEPLEEEELDDNDHHPVHGKPNSRTQLVNRNGYTAVTPQSPSQENPTRNNHNNNQNNYPPEDEEDLPEENMMDASSTSSSSPPPPNTTRCCSCCTIPQLLRFAGMIGMTFLNPLFCVLAMNYASPSILAPFSGLTLVWVIVFSKPLIDEYPTCWQKIASFLIVVGEVMVAVFGDHTNDEDTTPESILQSYQEPFFLAYFLAMAVWVVWLYVLIQWSSPTWRRFAWGTSGGSVTGLAQCFIKDALEVLKASPNGFLHMPFWNYGFVLSGITWSFVGLILLTQAMKRYDATYSSATFVGSFVVSASIMSAAHYHTFQHLNNLIDIIMYPLGLVILMMGVALLVQRGAHQTRGEPYSSSTYSNPRENRAYSDVFHPNDDIPDETDTTPVMVIPEVIHETTILGRAAAAANSGEGNHPPRFTQDELELVSITTNQTLLGCE